MIRFFRLGLYIFCIPAFGLFSLSAANVPHNELQIPSQFGSIRETFKSDSSPSSSRPMIIHIQDAHCNYEAQKNMSEILEHLIREHGLRLIMVEGGSGDVGLSFLRDYSDKETRERLAEQYLMSGEISGEEYLDIISDYDLELYGIEDEKLYEKNLKSFLDQEKFREQGLRDLDAIGTMVRNLKKHLNNEDLEEFELKQAEYEKKTISLKDYCFYLREKAQNRRDLGKYINFSSFMRIAGFEASLDFQKAESQRNEFIKELASLLDPSRVSELIEKTKNVKSGEMAPYDYYLYLKRSSRGKIDISLNYPCLDDYIVYMTLSKDIDASALLQELKKIENSVQDSLCQSDEQRKLLMISRGLSMLEKFLSIELPPEEYAYFREHKQDLSVADWLESLHGLCARYYIRPQKDISTVIDDHIGDLEKFYELGTAREKAFFSKMEDKLSSCHEKIAVLITGGFHTPGLTRLLKENGYSYMVVAPVITRATDSSTYFSVLKGETSQRELTADRDRY